MIRLELVRRAISFLKNRQISFGGLKHHGAPSLELCMVPMFRGEKGRSKVTSLLGASWPYVKKVLGIFSCQAEAEAPLMEVG